MRNSDFITNPKTIRKYQRWAEEKAELDEKIKVLKRFGYKVYRTLRAGSNSNWSYSLNEIHSGIAFDSQYSAWKYIINITTEGADKKEEAI